MVWDWPVSHGTGSCPLASQLSLNTGGLLVPIAIAPDGLEGGL